MSLAPGTRLGAYEIVAPLGAGGMGEVYRATDTTLGREVAVKVLPDAVAADDGRVARFEREARTLATLNHPHIAQVYGFERSGGTPALVMELVEGPTLADRIARGPLPLDEALAIAKQIAEALEAAHARNVVHRDLKPANVKVRPDGTVKVLDFGLAKALGPGDDGSSFGADLTASPTLTTPAMTQMGLVLGTAAYMAPEQARGQAVDRRADIWAFGCVLYEMLTGRRAFDAEDVSMTLAEVLKTDPDLSALPSSTPAAVRRLLRRCLQKNPANRLHDIADARLDIADALAAPEPETPASLSPAPVTGGRDRLAWGVAGVLLLALAGVSWFALSRPADEARALRLSIQLPEGLDLALSTQVGVPTSLLVSPDGRRLAVIARDAEGQDIIMVRGLDSPTFQPLAGTEGVTSMFWSPRSDELAFMARNTLRRISVTGGPPEPIVSIEGGFGGGTWNQEDTIVFSTIYRAGASFVLMRVPAGGGEPRVAVEGTAVAIRPSFLPDGQHLVFAGTVPEETFGPQEGIPIYVAGLGGGELVRIGRAGSSNVLYAEGHLLFLREGTLMAWPFDAERLETTGDAFPVVENVEGQGSTPPYGLFSASSNGLLVYCTGSTPSGDARLTWFDRDGTMEGTVGRPGQYVGVELSPDEQRAAVTAGGSALALDIWLLDLERGVDSRFTFGTGSEIFPVWSPDGRRVAFAAGSDLGPTLRAFEKASDGTGGETRLIDADAMAVPMDWSAGGLLYVTLNNGQADLHMMPPSGGEPYALLDSEFAESQGALSPDGRWLAYRSNEAGDGSIYVARFTGVAGERAGGRVRVSAGSGMMPRWRGDSRELFYYVPDRDALMSVAVDGTGDRFRAEVAEERFSFGRRLIVNDTLVTYDVTQDGSRVLAVLSGTAVAEAKAPVTVIVNWLAASGR